MTAHEAIECIEEVLNADTNYDESLDYQLTSDDIDWLNAAKEALEKQIQKKPIIGDTFSQKFQKAIIKSGQNADIAKGQSYKCPVCHQGIITLCEAERNEKIYGCKCKDNFCKKCGQALDWSDNE